MTDAGDEADLVWLTIIDLSVRDFHSDIVTFVLWEEMEVRAWEPLRFYVGIPDTSAL